MRLKIEPKPSSTWGITLASRLPKNEWDDLRAKVYRDADYKCEICGASDRTLNCHEVWIFDERRRIQRLFKFECCCDLCHDVHHFGRSRETRSPAYVDRLIGHWCRVNKKSRANFMEYEREIFELNKKRADRFYIVKVGRMVLT